MAHSPPANPDITAARVASVIPGFFPGDLGIEPLEIDDDRASGRLVCDARHLHPGGFVHGGVWVSFADTVAAWGTMRSLPSGASFTTAELKCNVFASAVVGDELHALAEPLHRGARMQVWEVRISKASSPERLAAVFVCTQLVLDAPR